MNMMGKRYIEINDLDKGHQMNLFMIYKQMKAINKVMDLVEATNIKLDMAGVPILNRSDISIPVSEDDVPYDAGHRGF